MQTILQQLQNTTALEWIAVVFALAQVIFAVYNYVSNFIFGLISVIIYIYLFYTGGLFAEASLNIYYAIISIAGIYFWLIKKNETSSNIQKASNQEWIITIAITIASFSISYIILKNYTSSTVPIWDSTVAAFAWSGSYLLAKRKLENWLVLNISNFLAIPLQYQKGYVLTSLLTMILFIIAIIGFIKWKKLLRNK